MSKDKQVCRMDGRHYELTQGAHPLKAMIAAQREFSKRMGYDFSKMTESQREARIKELVLCIHAEATETLNWTNWKDWKKEKIKWDSEQTGFEGCDILAFTFQIFMCCGWSDEDIFQHFMRKVEINHERQDRNY